MKTWLTALTLLGGAAAATAGVIIRSSGEVPGGKKVTIGDVKEDPEQVRQQHIAACTRNIEQARNALDKGLWVSARGALERAQIGLITPGQRQTIIRLYEQLEGEADKRLTHATDLFNAGKYAEALKAYVYITRHFGPLPSAQKAKKILAWTKTDPKVRRAMLQERAQELHHQIDRIIALSPDSRAGRAAATRPAEPSRCRWIKQLAPDDQDTVLGLLSRIANDYVGCPAADIAAAELRQMAADKDFYGAYLERRRKKKAGNALSLAGLYAKSGLLKKAMERYRLVVREYPDMPQATEARKALARLEAKPGPAK